MSDTQLPVWEVFIQANPGIAHKHAGNVHAADAEMALQNARDVYSRRSEGMNIWVVLVQLQQAVLKIKALSSSLRMINHIVILLFIKYQKE